MENPSQSGARPPGHKSRMALRGLNADEPKRVPKNLEKMELFGGLAAGRSHRYLPLRV